MTTSRLAGPPASRVRHRGPQAGRINGAVLAVLCATSARAATLTAGPTTMTFPDGRGVAVTGGYATATPAVVVTDVGTDTSTVAAAYDRVGDDACTATVVTPNGSRFAFVDHWTVAGDGFHLARTVTVVAADPRDGGFDSRFGLHVPGVATVRDAELFAPGVWYRHNDHVVPKAIGADPSLGTYLIKETRLALPMVTARPNGTGPAVTVLHADARPATGLRDADAAAQTDPSIQYASLGFYDRDTVGLCYPGTEAAVSYGAAGPRLRFHPVRVGFSHAYDLLVRVGPGGDFPTVMTDAWRHAVDRYAPAVHTADPAVYADGLAVLAKYYRDDFPGGGRGWPFSVFVGLHPPRGAGDRRIAPPSGIGPGDYHLQSGFVGQQLPAAALMLRQANRDHDERAAARWASVVDFWVDRSLSPAGVPRTDYFCERGQWGRGPAFLRTIGDATEGVIDAHRARPTPRWLAYATAVGDWLLRTQRPDGTWPRSFSPDGSVAHPGAFNTTNPLRLLCELSAVTGDMKYLAAARRAGDWCLAHVDAPAAYVGGTTDNDNTIDKEAGVLALYGFQALYDATGDARWLAAAARAAAYAETWVYHWSYPVAPASHVLADVRSPWPDCGLVGQSLVATGHSYADMFMVGCSTAYYRLSLQTGDGHFRDVARLLADGANRPADLTGALRYPARGLIEEGVAPADFVANGPGTWLPWCTVAQVRPVADLQDLFGCDTIDGVETALTPDQRRARDRVWYAAGR